MSSYLIYGKISSPMLLFLSVLYIASFIVALGADDWFISWMGLELNMMVFIVLVYQKWSVTHIESCLKYFFVQSLGSAVFAGMVYGYSEMYEYCISLAMSMKLGAGPAYFWFPSVCQGLGWMACFMLMSIQKVIPLMLLTMFSGWVLWMIILTSMMIGAVGSFNQVDLKVILSFSSIHHMGWMIMCGMVEKTMWLYYLLMYSVVVFSIIYLLFYFDVNSLVMMSKQKGFWWFLLGMMSIAGVPPLLGFFLSWFAFYFVTQMNSFVLFIMLIMSLVMFYVYIRFAYDIFMGKTKSISWTSYIPKGWVFVDFIGIIGFILGSLLILMFLL